MIMWQLVSGVAFPSPEILFVSPDVYQIEWVPGIPRWYQGLTMACLESRPEHRPDAEEILLITRKFAVSPQSPQMQVHQDDWIPYARRRREDCHAHRKQWSLNQDQQDFHSHLLATPDTVMSEDEKARCIMTASRIYTQSDRSCRLKH